MNEQRIITIAAIIMAVVLFYVANTIVVKRFPAGIRYIRLSGLIYLSVTVVLMFLVRLRPILSISQVLVIEFIALGMHITVLAMIFFILYKFKSTDTVLPKDATTENKSDRASDKASDIESE